MTWICQSEKQRLSGSEIYCIHIYDITSKCTDTLARFCFISQATSWQTLLPYIMLPYIECCDLTIGCRRSPLKDMILCVSYFYKPFCCISPLITNHQLNHWKLLIKYGLMSNISKMYLYQPFLILSACLLSCLGKGESDTSLWICDSIWWDRPGSALVQVMAWCLTAPRHYLNQCWLIISKVHWN